MSKTLDPLDHAAVVCAALRKTTATSVLIEMNGGGNSGNISNAEINNANGQPVDKSELNHAVTFNSVEQGHERVDHTVIFTEGNQRKM